MVSLSELNSADDDRATTMVSPLIERAPNIARKVAGHRPFEDAGELSLAIRRELVGLSETEQIDLFRAHPELAPEYPLAMTIESQCEQGRFDLTSQQSEHKVRLAELNAQYHDKFGFPFITALVRHPDMDSVLREFETRLSGDRKSEIDNAIDQIATVSSSRVQASFGGGNAHASREAGANM